MTQKLLQDLCKFRMEECKTLLDNKYFSGSYYLGGYSIECALKACLAKLFNAGEIPDKKFVMDIYTHDLKSLIKLAGLEGDRAAKESTDNDFSINWAIVKDWNEGARYKEWTEAQAKELYDAITNAKGGVLSWIQQYW
jgi:hypothetical protein